MSDETERGRDRWLSYRLSVAVDSEFERKRDEKVSVERYIDFRDISILVGEQSTPAPKPNL